MTNNSASDLEVFIPLNGLMKNLDSFSQDMINKNEMDQVLCKRIEAAAAVLKEYFSSTHIEFLHELNSSTALINLRLFLRIFAPEEVTCVQIIDKFLLIGLKLQCVNQISVDFWSRVSPIQWFRDNNTSIY